MWVVIVYVRDDINVSSVILDHECLQADILAKTKLVNIPIDAIDSEYIRHYY